MNLGDYRYTLDRELPKGFVNEILGKRPGWTDPPRSVAVIMLNPSTATYEKNDPTIRRVIGFAKREGWEKVRILNLFARRGTDKREFLDFAAENFEAAVGPENDDAFRTALYDWANAAVIAWGTLPVWALPRVLQVLRFLNIADKPVFSLGDLTADKQPRHPLYLRADTPLVRRSPAHAIARLRAEGVPSVFKKL